MRKAGAKDYKSYSKKILKICDKKPVSLEVFGDNYAEMKRQALQINSWGKNVYVKIPVVNSKGKFSGKIINLHPSLLPKYGGKGMYGNNVHKAVLAAKEKKTGITIHYVNEQYDKGKIIDQFETALSDKDNLEDVLLKIKELERKYFPTTIEKLSLNR